MGGVGTSQAFVNNFLILFRLDVRQCTNSIYWSKRRIHKEQRQAGMPRQSHPKTDPCTALVPESWVCNRFWIACYLHNDDV